jgi:NIMA (never in mitosis gene a)-related kinase
MADNLRQIKLLGEGAFGKCYLCEDNRDKTLWVVKQIDISRMTPQEKREAYHEAKVMAAFDHPNIIKFKEVYTTTNGKLNIVMNYADGGDLQSKIKAQRGRLFSENEILDIFMQICLAMKHVHDRKVLHRDIKGQNIFLMRGGMIKLGDFGISKVLTNTIDKARTMVGTPYYLSPEIVEGRPYSFKSDVWSLGVLLYELCTLRPPFDGTSIRQLSVNICRGSYPPLPAHFSKELKNLVSMQLNLDPSRRPTVGQVLKLPFITHRIKNVLTESVRFQEFSHTILHNQNLFSQPKQDAKHREDEMRRKMEEERKKLEDERKKQEEERKKLEQKIKEEDDKRKEKLLKEAEARLREDELRRKEAERKRLEAQRQPLPIRRDPSREKQPDFKPKINEIPPFRGDLRQNEVIPIRNQRVNEISPFRPGIEAKVLEVQEKIAEAKAKLNEIPQFRGDGKCSDPVKPEERPKLIEIPPFRPVEERKVQPVVKNDIKNPVVYKPPPAPATPVAKYNPYIYQKIEDSVDKVGNKEAEFKAIFKEPAVKQEKDFKAKYDEIVKKKDEEKKKDEDSKKKGDDLDKQRENNSKKREAERKNMLRDIKKQKRKQKKNKEENLIQWLGDVKLIVKPENRDEARLIEVLQNAVMDSSEEEEVIPELPNEEEEDLFEREDRIGTVDVLILDREIPELSDMRFFIEDRFGRDETFKAYQLLKEAGLSGLDEKSLEQVMNKVQAFTSPSKAQEFLPLIETLVFLEGFC